MTPSDRIYNQASRDWEAEPEDEDDVCHDCLQRRCQCPELDAVMTGGEE